MKRIVSYRTFFSLTIIAIFFIVINRMATTTNAEILTTQLTYENGLYTTNIPLSSEHCYIDQDKLTTTWGSDNFQKASMSYVTGTNGIEDSCKIVKLFITANSQEGFENLSRKEIYDHLQCIDLIYPVAPQLQPQEEALLIDTCAIMIDTDFQNYWEAYLNKHNMQAPAMLHSNTITKSQSLDKKDVCEIIKTSDNLVGNIVTSEYGYISDETRLNFNCL